MMAFSASRQRGDLPFLRGRRLTCLSRSLSFALLLFVGACWNATWHISSWQKFGSTRVHRTNVGADATVSSINSNLQVDSTNNLRVNSINNIQVDGTEDIHVNSPGKREVDRINRHLLNGGSSPVDNPPKDESFECIHTDRRSDYCLVKGDVRLDQRYNLFVLYAQNVNTRRGLEKIKPYTRKGDPFVSEKLPEFTVLSVDAPKDAGFEPSKPETELDSKKETKNSSFPWVQQPEDVLYDVDGNRLDSESHWELFKRVPGVVPGLAENGSHVTLHCEVRHNVPVVVFTTGGYTGNLYHEFADGLIPLYITAKRFNGEVILAIAEWHYGWLRKYRTVLSQMSNYEPLLLGKSKKVNCFPEAIVGQVSHDEFVIDPKKMPNGETMQDFQKILFHAYRRFSVPFQPFEPHKSKRTTTGCDPILTIIVRQGSRVLLNIDEVILWAQDSGFVVRTIEPDHYKPLPYIWHTLQETAVMLGVHGAAMSHFVFLRPGTVFIQLIPLATVWPSATYYGNPSIDLGIQYIGVNISITESSLSKVYPPDDPVLTDPVSVYVKHGYGKVKEIFMDKQNVTFFKENAIQTLRAAQKLLENVEGKLEMSARDRRCSEKVHQKSVQD